MCTTKCYLASLVQMASAVRIRISLPSTTTQSQILNKLSRGRHVANMVRNHCIVNTLVSGGSTLIPIVNIKCTAYIIFLEWSHIRDYSLWSY